MPWTTLDELNIVPKTLRMSLADEFSIIPWTSSESALIWPPFHWCLWFLHIFAHSYPLIYNYNSTIIANVELQKFKSWTIKLCHLGNSNVSISTCAGNLNLMIYTDLYYILLLIISGNLQKGTLNKFKWSKKVISTCHKVSIIYPWAIILW